MSEDKSERAEAAERCHGCPVITQCAESAARRRERFGVWAGKDRTKNA